MFICFPFLLDQFPNFLIPPFNTRYFEYSQSSHSLVHLMWGQEVRDRVILVVHKCIWNALVVLLGPPSPTFNNSGSLDYLQCWVAYHQLCSNLVPASRFFPGNREAELNPSTFSSVLLLGVFLHFLFSRLPADIVP